MNKFGERKLSTIISKVGYHSRGRPEGSFFKRYNSEIGLVSLFNGISTFVGYLMPKPFS